MENTCRFPECEFAKFLKLKKAEQCCNFQQNWFKKEGQGEDQTPKLINDCAPIRTSLMIQTHYGRLVGVQQAMEQQRNVTFQVVNKFNEIIERVNARILGIPRGDTIRPIEIPE